MKYTLLLSFATMLLLGSCANKIDYDASGYFEADEVIVSAQQNGQLLTFPVEEGMSLKAGSVVGQIDVNIAWLQKQQTEETIASLNKKISDPEIQTELVNRQLQVEKSQLDQLIREQKRTQNLVLADAATQKQLDDINAQIEQLQKQMGVTRTKIQLNTYNTHIQNQSILSEKSPLEKTASVFQEQISKGSIINPIDGIVLIKYALPGEFQTPGKPLYKIANLDTLTLRAYITGSQLSQIKIGQTVKARIDRGEKNYKYYQGQICWISDESEFTPKTIQTKDERANLVYAIKIRVKNDGILKIGMYGEVIWNQHS